MDADHRNHLHKVGAWYAYVLSAGSEGTVAAITDAYKELSSKIASQMWEPTGAYVQTAANRMDPTERTLRTVVSQSLASLGISSHPNAHIVNTPYVASLLLPDRDVALFFTSDSLSDGRLVGQTRLMASLVEKRGYRVRLLPTAEWERKFAAESQDEFLASLLKLIQ
jgi:hypothetical protein